MFGSNPKSNLGFIDYILLERRFKALLDHHSITSLEEKKEVKLIKQPKI